MSSLLSELLTKSMSASGNINLASCKHIYCEYKGHPFSCTPAFIYTNEGLSTTNPLIFLITSFGDYSSIRLYDKVLLFCNIERDTETDNIQIVGAEYYFATPDQYSDSSDQDKTALLKIEPGELKMWTEVY